MLCNMSSHKTVPSQEDRDTEFHSEDTNDIKPTWFIFVACEVVQKCKNVGRIKKDTICKLVMQRCKNYQRRILT